MSQLVRKVIRPHGSFARYFSSAILSGLVLTLLCGSGAVRAAEPSSAQATNAERVNLNGTVLDADSKEAVSGATVYLYTAAPRVGLSVYCPSCYADCSKKASTGTYGTFRLANLDPSLLFRVLVVRQGYAPMFVEKVDPQKGEISIVLRRPDNKTYADRFVIRGRVVGPTGKPQVGAVVEPNAIKWGKGSTGFGYEPTVEPLTITDGAGEFLFHCKKAQEDTDYETKVKSLQPITAMQVNVHARDHARTKAWLKVDTAEVQTIPLAVGATVQGIVRDQTGKGVPGIRVIVSQSSRNSETYLGATEIATGPDGVFLIPNIKQDDRYGVTVAMESLKQNDLAAPVQTLAVGKDETDIRNINLLVQPASTINGRVVLPNNQPIAPDTRILLSREDSWDSQEVALTVDGRFSFRGLPPGETVSLYLRILGYKTDPKTTGLKSWGSIEMKLKPLAEAIPLVIRMVPESKMP